MTALRSAAAVLQWTRLACLLAETGIADAQDRLRSEFITSHYNMVRATCA